MNPQRGKNFFARNVDANQSEIVAALRKAGYDVYLLHRTGFGIPDLLVLSKTNIPVLLEIKIPGGKLKPAEKKFHEEYRGPVAIVDCVEQAIEAMQKYDGVYYLSNAKTFPITKEECI